jgi:hypothetical protein
MDKNNHTPPHFIHTHNKNNEKNTQIKIISEYLKINVATVSMIKKATGVPHPILCRYIRNLEKSKIVHRTNISSCIVTGFKAQYWHISEFQKVKNRPDWEAILKLVNLFIRLLDVLNEILFSSTDYEGHYG